MQVYHDFSFFYVQMYNVYQYIMYNVYSGMAKVSDSREGV